MVIKGCRSCLPSLVMVLTTYSSEETNFGPTCKDFKIMNNGFIFLKKYKQQPLNKKIIKSI